MSNVDNLGATLEPAVVGAHLAAGAEMTVEVVERRKGEPGGAPARVGGKLQIVEDFRFPEGFSLDSIPFFNTNTFVLDAAALDGPFELSWFLVRKKVDGQDAIRQWPALRCCHQLQRESGKDPLTSAKVRRAGSRRSDQHGLSLHPHRKRVRRLRRQAKVQRWPRPRVRLLQVRLDRGTRGPSLSR
jgi:hypothetical protein